MKLHPYFTSYTKINTKWVKDINVRLKMKKLIEENIGDKFYDLGFRSDFWDMTLKPQVTKAKIDKRGLHQT